MKKREKIFTALALAAVLAASPLAAGAVPVSAEDDIYAADADFDCISETGTALSGENIVIKTYPDGVVKADKKITTIVTMSDGRRYLLDNGHVTRNDLVNMYGHTYAVKEDGTICSDEFFGAKGEYYADKNGWIVKSSVIRVYGNDYATDNEGRIVKDSGAVVKGAHNKSIFVLTDENGIIYKNCFVKKDGITYHAGKSGEIDRDKIIKADGKRYAVSDTGEIQPDSVVKVHGIYYVNDHDGSLAIRKWVATKRGVVFGDKNGRMISAKVMKKKTTSK